jgi:uncharacterized RDD family membrane protein YckC
MSSPEQRLWWYIDEEDSWGPVTQDALRDLVVSGRLGHSFLVWSPGLDDWRPIDSVAELGALFQPPPSPSQGQRWSAWPLEQQTTVFNPPSHEPRAPERPPEAAGDSDSRTSPPADSSPHLPAVVGAELAKGQPESAAPEPPIVVIDYSERITPDLASRPSSVAPLAPAGPWRRFFARAFDLQWESFIVAALTVWLVPVKIWTSPYATLALIFTTLPLALVLDALVSAVFGATPGKALLGLKVVDLHAEPLKASGYLARNAALWVEGLGLGVPVLTLITLFVALRKVRHKQSAAWDRAKGSRVLHQPKPAISALIFLISWIALSSGGSLALARLLETRAVLPSFLREMPMKWLHAQGSYAGSFRAADGKNLACPLKLSNCAQLD